MKANRHWSEMPADFEKNLAKYRAEGAVIFEGVDYFQIWAMLMTKQYKALAKRFVDLSDKRRSDDEIIAFLRARTQAIKAAPDVRAAA